MLWVAQGPTGEAELPSRCDKYPSLERRFCSHCQGTARGTRENPHFSIRYYKVNRRPVVEILKNGGPIHRNDARFAYGVCKAGMLIACLPALRVFAWGSTADRQGFQAQAFRSDALHLSVRVFVEMKPDFVRSTGEFIDEPWLRLEKMPTRNPHLGVGVMKCRAVWSVQDELRAWVDLNKCL